MHHHTVWDVCYCFDGLQYQVLKSFKTTPGMRGDKRARLWMEKLLKTPKYKNKKQQLWVEVAGEALMWM